MPEGAARAKATNTAPRRALGKIRRPYGSKRLAKTLLPQFLTHPFRERWLTDEQRARLFVPLVHNGELKGVGRGSVTASTALRVPSSPAKGNGGASKCKRCRVGGHRIAG